MTEEINLDWKRIGWLTAFWLPYFVIPWATGWSFASNVECAFCWGDLFRFSFSLLGYGVIGCWFYAVTENKKSDTEFRDRLTKAMGINVLVFILSIYIVADWNIILL